MRFDNIFKLSNEALGDAVLLDHVTKKEMDEEREDMDKALELDAMDQDVCDRDIILNDICKDVEIISQEEISLYNQLKNHDKVLARKDAGIFNGDLVTAHTDLTKSILKLGGSESDLCCIRLSSESLSNKRVYLTVSRENVLETMKHAAHKSLELVKDVGREVRNYGVKLGNIIKFREKQLINLSQYCNEHEEEQIGKLSNNNLQKVYEMFYMFIKSNNNTLDLNKILDYITTIERNPFIHNIDALYQLASNSNRTNDDIDNFLNKVNNNANTIPYQKLLLEQVNKESNLREPSLYVVSCLGTKVGVYIRDPEHKGLGVKYQTLKYDIPSNTEFNLKGISSYKDLDKVINKVTMIYNNSNTYLKKLESINSRSLEIINKLNTIKDSDDLVIKQAYALVKSIGSEVVYKSIKQYNELTGNVIKTCQMLVNANKTNNSDN